MRAKAQPSGRQLEAWKETTKSQPIANGRFAHKRPFAATFRNGSKWSTGDAASWEIAVLQARRPDRPLTPQASFLIASVNADVRGRLVQSGLAANGKESN